MNFNHTGLFISVLVLLGMLITCHLRNYFNKPPRSAFINLSVPTGTPPLQYNKISYTPKQEQIPCEIAAQGNFPCSQIQTCQTQTQATDKQLSDSELAILYKITYEQAGLELMNRILQKQIK
jgi:hypothetical protein